MKVVTRIDIEAKRGKELQDALRKNRQKYNIIAVRCLSKEVARIVAREERVDILLFPEDPTQRRQNWLDHHGAGAPRRSRACIRDQRLRIARSQPHAPRQGHNDHQERPERPSRHDIPVVLSSGATSFILMREPRALTALEPSST